MPVNPGINIFARELERAMNASDYALSYLDDLQDAQGYIVHKQKAKRIKDSLSSPKHLATLNPDELARLIARLDWDMPTQLRLKAAVLATAVEMTLMNRIPTDLALQAANQVFDIMLMALQNSPDLAVKVKGDRSPGVGETFYGDDDPYEIALRYYDDGNLILHACTGQITSAERQMLAEQAIATFTHARSVLDSIQDQIDDKDGLSYWQQEIQNGIHMAERFRDEPPQQYGGK